MLHIQIDQMIAAAMKAHDGVKLRTFRALKTAFTQHSTAKDAKPLDEASEVKILKKMISDRTESARIYLEAGREQLANEELEERDVLATFLPAEVSVEEMEMFANILIVEKGMPNMGKYVQQMKAKFPTADGKVIASIVKSRL